MHLKATLQDRGFLSHLARLAGPIAAQNFLVTAVNMVDTVMIGRLGAASVAAVSLANQIYFLLILFLFGIGSGAAVFSAQYWGKRDRQGVHRTYGLALTAGLAGGLLFTLGGQLVPGGLIALYSDDPEVIEIGARYLRVVSISYLATAVSFITTNVLRSMGSVRLPLVATGISLVLNSLGNYVLIFGKLGLPAMGVDGAALSTLIARLLEIAMILGFVYGRRHPLAAPIRQLFSYHMPFVKAYVRRAAPVLANEIGWSVGTTMYKVIYAQMGTEVIAGFSVAETLFRLSFVLFVGSGNAAAVMIGNAIGAGQREEAQRYTEHLLTLVPMAAVGVGAVLFLLAPVAPRWYGVEPHVAALATSVLRVAPLVLLIKAMNLHIIVGILRAGGDTIFGMIVEIVCLWLVGVPGSAVAGLVWAWPLAAVFLVTALEELSKFILGILRIRSGRWMTEVTV